MVDQIKKNFSWQITFGNILTIIIFVIGGLLGYARLEERVNQMARDLADHKQQQINQMNELVRRDVQETRNSFIDRQLEDMQIKLDKILQLMR